MVLKITLWSLAGFGGLALLLSLVIAAITYRPGAVERAPVVCRPDAPLLSLARHKAAAPLKIMSWNVQFMAGKDYVFFFDLPDDYERPPNFETASRPKAASIARTLDEVARVIRDEAPDIVLLQEVDDGAKRTDESDQLALLLERLGEDYPCHASTFYWKAAFVPHPRIMGAVGMKLSVLSRFRIDRATRYALAPIESDNLLTRQFNLKRALLEVILPTREGSELAVFNVHLSAFSVGTRTLARQAAQVLEVLDETVAAGRPFVIGGDFNMLPSATAYDLMPPERRYEYARETEITPFFERFDGVPKVADAQGPDRADYFTHFLNEPDPHGPDRTIDYLFVSPNLEIPTYYVRSHDTLKISDHLPLVAEIKPREPL